MKRQSSFTESLLCRYMVDRSNTNSLYLFHLGKNARQAAKPVKRRVEAGLSYKNTRFPDFNSIKIRGSRKTRQAEVKYLTSLFNYHNDSPNRFKKFLDKNGCIITLMHDELPRSLDSYDVDVYQLDLEDYQYYISEGANRLLKRQIQKSDSPNFFVLYAGLESNFNKGSNRIKPGRESEIYSIKEKGMAKLLTPKTKLLITQISGIDRKGVEKNPGKYTWTLEDLTIAEVISAEPRELYCAKKGLHKSQKLWQNDSKRGHKWHWNTVIEFKTIGSVKRPIKPTKLKECTPLLNAIENSFKDSRPTTLLASEYSEAMEVLATI